MNLMTAHLPVKSQQGYSLYHAQDTRRKGVYAQKPIVFQRSAPSYGPAAILDLSRDASAIVHYLEEKAS